MKGSAPSSSSARSPAAMDRPGTPDGSCYFPGCRKDMNCDCEICLASIEATLDLKRSSVRKFSHRTKIPQPTYTPEKTGTVSTLWSPASQATGTEEVSESPLRSTAKSRRVLQEKKDKGGKRCGAVGYRNWTVLLGVSLVLMAEFGFPLVLVWVFRPLLLPEMVQRVGKESASMGSLEARLQYLKERIEEIGRVKAFNCSVDDSIWKLNQDGFLLSSYCTLYESRAEEVRIWGWPLQTAGLLVTSFSSRAFTLISGRITEWPEGSVGFVMHKRNSSWTHEKWSISPLQLDPGTWVLEYRRNAVLENPKFFSTVTEFVRRRRLWKKIVKQDFKRWAAPIYGGFHKNSVTLETARCPT